MKRDKLFFKCRSVVLKTRKKCGLLAIVPKVVCKMVNRSYGAGIPISESVNEFSAPHGFSGIFISKDAKIGKGCTIFQQVTIGSNRVKGSKGYGAPVIGDNVLIGAGAKIIGKVKIGNNAKIGAGCVVCEDVPEGATVVMPHPRVIVKNGDKK